MIIGLAGYARVGKDTIGKILVDGYGFERVAFADALKDDIDPLFSKFGNVDKEIIRPVYVAYGRACRQIEQNHWVRRSMLWAMDAINAVVTDVRYPKEVREIIELGGVVVMVNRPGFGPANEEERRSIEDILAEFSPLQGIDNQGTIADLCMKVAAMIESIKSQQAWRVGDFQG